MWDRALPAPFEHAGQALGGHAHVRMVGLENEVADLPIQRVALFGHGDQALFAVRSGQQGAAAVVAQSFQLFIHPCTQPYDEATRAQERTIVGAQYGAASGGEQQSVAFRCEHLSQCRVFAFAESDLALVFEDQRNARAAALLDFTVEVDEVQAETFGQATTDGAFAGAHRSDQDEVWRGIHARMLASPAGSPRAGTMLRFFLIFMGLLITLFAARISTFGAKYVTEPFTAVLADISAHLIMMFDSNVHAEGVIIQSTTNGFAVAIAPGCDGIEAVIILISALMAFPSPWKHKLVGAVVGFFCIQALNLVRIISLFYMGQWSQVAFDWFHLYLWQALIVLDALAVWLIWLRYLPKTPRRRPPTDGPGEPATA